ncbi:MAG: SDR family oxidoreductase [Anaerolineae bacterium]|nr:SDR family oxidoreductase [Anaerolineae bacterium]
MKRVALITGVAGGIGNGAAKVFQQADWYVIGVDRRQVEDLQHVDYFIQADISEPDAPQYIFDKVTAEQGRLDALINNAAIQICKPILETTPDEWDITMASNVRSVYLSMRQAYSLLQKSQGSVVNVSSVHAVATSVGIAAYAASKGALLALTRAVALEWGVDRIRVNAVLPGAIDTPMLHAGLGRGQVTGSNLEELVRGLGHKHVMNRVGRPEEIGQAVLFLADNQQSSFMTGQALIVDGGATARLSTE